MLKDKFAVLSVISLFLYAIMCFCKEAIETSCHVRLIIAQVNYTSTDWQINGEPVQQLLLILAAVCLIIAIINTVIDAVQHRRKQK